jgi:RNA-directed DNA polymerase
VFTSLAHHLTEEYLNASFRELKKSAASGIDGKSAHHALSYLRKQCMNRKTRCIIDADIQGCFDNFDHEIMIDLLSKRIKDKSIMKLIMQWLKVGVVDGNSMQINRMGTPQEGGAYRKHPVGVFSERASMQSRGSPLLCNVYLHYVLDEWMNNTIRPLLKGEVFLTRYADDFIIGFENEEDAQRVYKVLPKRMGKFGLTIHPEKSKLIEFAPKGKGKVATLYASETQNSTL